MTDVTNVDPLVEQPIDQADTNKDSGEVVPNAGGGTPPDEK